MREMKESGIEWVGMIPNTWKVLRNKYNFELDKRIIGSKCINTQLLSLTKNGIKAITEEEQSGKVPTSFTTYQVVDTDDLVMCLFDLDVSAVFSGISPYSGMISPAYKCLKCKDHLSPKYIDYYFKTVFVDRKYKRYSKNVRYSLSSDEFMALPIIVPPLSEQDLIADYLDSKCIQIDNISKRIQEEIDTLEDYKKSVITEAVTRGLDPNVEMKDSGIEYIGEYPSSWSIKRLKYILTERNERSITGEEELLSVSQYKGVIPSKENANRTMQAASLVGYKLVKKNDLVFNKLNPGLARFGWSGFDGITSPDFAVYMVDKNICHAKFLQVLLKSSKYVTKIKSLSAGVGDGFARLYTPQLYDFSVAVPSNIHELYEIIRFIDELTSKIDQLIEKKQMQLSTLEEYKNSLIYEYVTGKKEVA